MDRKPRAPRADSHIHLFEHGFSLDGERDCDLVAYEQIRADHGVGQALVVCYEGSPEYAGNNAYVAGLAERYGWIRPAAYVEVSDAGRTSLADLRAPFVGATLYLLEPETAEAAAAWSSADWEPLRAMGGLVSLNVRAPLLGAAVRLGRAAAPVPVLLSHLGLPGAVDPATTEGSPDAVLHDLLAAAAVPNLHVKVSGLYALGAAATDVDWQRKAVAAVVEAYGASRVHWGSDFPPVLGHDTISGAFAEDVLSALPADAAAMVRGPSLAILLAATGQ